MTNVTTLNTVKSAIQVAREEVQKEVFDKNKDRIKRILRDIQAAKTTVANLERELAVLEKEIEASSNV